MVLISLFVDWIGSITTIMDAIRSLPKYITLICGNLFVGAGIGLYVSTNLCAAPQEAFVLTVAEKKKWTFRRTEISLAFLFLTLSFLLDEYIYFGTIILSFTTGWIIQAFIQVGTQILNRKNLLSKLLNRFLLVEILLSISFNSVVCFQTIYFFIPLQRM